jgi:hypothetical protein
VTLVEVVIAIFVLTVGVLSIISLFPSGYSLSQAAVDRSVAALAARDAQARILAAVRKGDVTLPDISPPATEGVTSKEPLLRYRYWPDYVDGVPAEHRVGLITDVAEHQLTCKILGNLEPFVSPSNQTEWNRYWPDFGGGEHFLVITSGSAANTVLPIQSNSGGAVTFDSSILFRVEGETAGLPVRVGDHFAIIGNKTGSLCYPTNFVGGGAGRTIEIATKGDPEQHPWAYSYGCIISAPTLAERHICRVDVFVYRNMQDAGTLQEQEQPAGHFVTYIHHLDDYDNP